MQSSFRQRTIARALLGLFYLTAGVIHCLAPGPFVAVTPPWVPYPHGVVILTGLCEIAGAAGQRSRQHSLNPS